MAKSVVYDTTEQASKTDILLFCSEQSFYSTVSFVNMFLLFVCLSDCKYLLFRCVSDTLAGDFLSAQLIYRGKVELCHPLYDFREKNSKLFFEDGNDREN